jgi:cephalosporin hydroxylase
MTWMPEHLTPVHCVQLVEEFTPLLALVRDVRPARLLEIGSHAGGTLYHFLQCMAPGGHATAISLQATAYCAPWPAWADAAGVGLTILDADSTAETAETQAAMPPFMSTAPRPNSTPSLTSARKGSADQPSAAPVGTTSV